MLDGDPTGDGSHLHGAGEGEAPATVDGGNVRIGIVPVFYYLTGFCDGFPEHLMNIGSSWLHIAFSC